MAGIAARDALQREHTLLRNFPLIGHARYLPETIAPELRQYLRASNNEERPFTRDQRRWVYASAKKQNNYFGFGTDNDIDIEYTGLSGDQAPHLRPGHPTVQPGRRPRGRPAQRQTTRRKPQVAGGIPAGVGGQRLGDELRIVIRPGH
jgi:hypothetical protein